MKKIIATVLAMVMALALCTTAFAATGTKVVATGDKSLKETYYVDASDEYFVDKDCTKRVTAAVEEVLLNGGYEAITLKLYKGVAAATCSKDGYAVNVYIDADGCLFAKVDDVDDYEEDFETTLLATKSVRYIGTKMENVVKYYEVGTTANDGDDQLVIAKGHALMKTEDTFGEESEAPVYKCLLCGGTFVNVDDIVVDDKAAVAKLDRIDYTQNENFEDIAFDKDFLNAEEAEDGTYYVVKAGTVATTTTTTTSPKTFDAGIAMYVGMALTSVAGSAVVIGKKKEF